MVHWHKILATDSDSSSAASAAKTRGWSSARRTHAVQAIAAPLVTPVLWISQARGLYSASAPWPCAEANADRTEVRAAVPAELTRSSTRRHRACSSAVIAVASAAARYRIADRSMSSASSALPGDTTSFIVTCHLPRMLADGGAGSSPRAVRAGLGGLIDWSDSTPGRGHFPGTRCC